jgi:hypothetical protein
LTPRRRRISCSVTRSSEIEAAQPLHTLSGLADGGQAGKPGKPGLVQIAAHPASTVAICMRAPLRLRCRGCLGPGAFVFGRVEDLEDRLAGGEDAACGQGDPADRGVVPQAGWPAQVSAVQRGL